jgi:hypothetical protein
MAVKSIPEQVGIYWKELVEKYPTLRCTTEKLSLSREQLDTFQKFIVEKVERHFSSQTESDSPRALSITCGRFVYDSILEGAAETAKFGKRMLTLALPDVTMNVSPRDYSVMQHYKAPTEDAKKGAC